MSDLNWTSAITSVQPNELRLRGYRIDELMDQVSFGGVLYLALRGELPSPAQGQMVDAILVSSVDHGATPPSCLSARTVASTGAPLNAAMAAGVLAINRFHGGAIEDAMRTFAQIAGRVDEADSVEDAVAVVADEFRAQKKRFMGYGHRLHTADPRTARLLALAHELGVAGVHVAVARALEATIARTTGRQLPLNVDGAVAAVLADLGFEPEVGNAFFIIARTVGLVAHVREEQTRERKMRRIHPTDHGYDGPAPRDLPD